MAYFLFTNKKPLELAAMTQGQRSGWYPTADKSTSFSQQLSSSEQLTPLYFMLSNFTPTMMVHTGQAEMELLISDIITVLP